MDSDTNANINPNEVVAVELIVTPVIVEDCPPSYEVVMDPSRGPPPSYDSLFAKVKEAHKSRKNILDFLKNLILLLLGLFACAFLLILFNFLPLSMIYFGWTYLYDCPEEEHIPIYLLVAGGALLFRHIIYYLCSNDKDLPLVKFIDLFLFAWSIAGTIWVYKVYEPNYDPSYGKYCNKILYMFAFWLFSVLYIMLGLITITTILYVIYYNVSPTFIYR